MKPLSRTTGALLLVISLAAIPPSLLAQSPGQDVEHAESSPGVQPEPDDPPTPHEFQRRSPVFRAGGNFVLGRDDESDEVLVLRGHARIDGHVRGDVCVIFGETEIGDTASIDGNLIVIGGSVSVASATRVRGGFIATAAAVNEAPGFTPGDVRVVVDPNALGIDTTPLGAWITHGLLMGRPLPPALQPAWIVVVLCALSYLIVLLVAERPVRQCAQTLGARPVTTFLTGLLVLLLAGPVVLLLVVSIAGLVVLPFAFTGLIVVWIVGKVGVMRWIGTRAVPETLQAGDVPSRAVAIRSFAIGAAVLTLAYTLPIVGLLAWMTSGVLALGTATLTLFEGYRRENPALPVVRKSRAGVVVPSAAPPVTAMGNAPLSIPRPPADAEPLPSEPTLATPPLIPSVSTETSTRATFTERAAAFALDVVVVILTAMFLNLLDLNPERNFMLLLLLYHIAFWTTKGTTIGGMICQLRVVRLDGQPLQLGDAFIRGLAGILSGAVAGLGFLWMLKKPERETWHDKIAGTTVVKVPRHVPIYEPVRN